MVRNTGTFTGDTLLPNSLNYKANGKEIRGCPETFSVIFDDEGKIKYLSVGYPADRFEGNTYGKGAAVGIFLAIGIPFPSPGPLLQFAQFMGTEVFTGFGPKSYSVNDVPEWWTDENVAGEGFL